MESSAGQLLLQGLTALLQGLAKQVAWDGEGATCLFEVRVSGGASVEDCNNAAKAVAGSSLVKAAVFGHDPNIGRIACAVGYSGAAVDEEKLEVILGDTILISDGKLVDFDAALASQYLKETAAVHGTVVVKVDLGVGKMEGIGWGCDLSYDYVKINALYTT